MLTERDLIREISPNERVFVHSQAYFEQALSAVEIIDGLIDNDPRRILDLPSGHGRVMRALRARFPTAEIVACDVLETGVQFCAETFDAVPVPAPTDPRELELEGEFDLIWCGSLLTHLRPQRWTHFMDLFERHLAKDGTLVATTHGRRVATWARQGKNDLGLEADALQRLLSNFWGGFAYESFRGYPDYGISLAMPAWVINHLQRPSLRLLTFTEAGWDDFQDVYAVRASGRV